MPNIYIFNFIPFISRAGKLAITKNKPVDSNYIRQDIQSFERIKKILIYLHALQHKLIIIVGGPCDKTAEDSHIQGLELATRYLDVLLPYNNFLKEELYVFAQPPSFFDSALTAKSLQELKWSELFIFNKNDFPSKHQCLITIGKSFNSSNDKTKERQPYKGIILVDYDPAAIKYAQENGWRTIQIPLPNIPSENNSDSYLKILENDIETETKPELVDAYNKLSDEMAQLEQNAKQCSDAMNKNVAEIMPEFLRLDRLFRIYAQIQIFYSSILFANLSKGINNNNETIIILKKDYDEMFLTLSNTFKAALKDHLKMAGGVLVKDKYVAYGKSKEFETVLSSYYKEIDEEIKRFNDTLNYNKMCYQDIELLINNFKSEKDKTEQELLSVSEKRNQIVNEGSYNLNHLIPLKAKAVKLKQNSLYDQSKLLDNKTEIKSLIQTAINADINAFRKLLPWIKSKEVINTLYEVDNETDHLTPLQVACLKGNTPNHLFFIRRLVEEYSVDINQYSYQGFTPLHLAIRGGNTPVVSLLLKLGANIGAKTQHWPDLSIAKQGQRRYSSTPLHTAIYHSNLDITKLLIENGANINMQDADGNTPLHQAVQYGLIEIIKFLLKDKDINLNLKNKFGYHPMEMILEHGDSPLTLNLLKTFMNNGYCFTEIDLNKWLDKSDNIPDRYGFIRKVLYNLYTSYIERFQKNWNLKTASDSLSTSPGLFK